MNNNKPYDKEIEYLESKRGSVAQTFPYITIPHIIDDADTELYIKFLITQNDTNYIITNQYDTINEVYRFIVTNTGVLKFLYNSLPSAVDVQFNIEPLSIYHCHTFVENDKFVLENMDSGVRREYPMVSYQFINQNPLRVFGSYAQTNSGCYVRIYELKILHKGKLLFDMVPVRKGDKGYFYNKVTGRLFGNERENSEWEFILGPDKEEDTNTFIIKGKFKDDSTNEDWWIKNISGYKLDITSFVDPLTKEFFYFTDNKPSYLTNLFWENSALERIDEISGTDKCLSVQRLFGRCKNLKSVNLDKLDTSFCNDFREMFLQCESIESLRLPKMDTRHGALFDYCFQFMNSLKQLTLGKYFTCENATSIYAMFNNSKLLKEVTLHFDLGKCTNASALLSPSAELKTIKGSIVNVRISISLQGLTSLSFDSAMLFINALEKVETAQTITLPVHIYDSLSEQQKTIISDKGWTIQKA